MKLIFGSNHPFFSSSGCALTFGNFDGVHLGHQALLNQLRQEADKRGLPVAVVLFEPQPEEFFKKSQAAPRITSLRDKLICLRACGVDVVYCIRFTEKTAQQSAEQFIQDVLFLKLGAQYILLGEDARFGKDRKGNVALLQKLAEPQAITVALFSNYLLGDRRVSSTAIRAYLEKGELVAAARLLGRDYQVCGRVTYGEGRGQAMGFPTANLAISMLKPILTGVYVVSVKTAHAGVQQGVANWGKRPTFGQASTACLEVHLFQPAIKLYGQFLEITFLKKLRTEMKFESVQELVHQIHQDIHEAKIFFSQGCVNGNIA